MKKQTNKQKKTEYVLETYKKLSGTESKQVECFLKDSLNEEQLNKLVLAAIVINNNTFADTGMAEHVSLAKNQLLALSKVENQTIKRMKNKPLNKITFGQEYIIDEKADKSDGFKYSTYYKGKDVVFRNLEEVSAWVKKNGLGKFKINKA